jgi:hypothetical protein
VKNTPGATGFNAWYRRARALAGPLLYDIGRSRKKEISKAGIRVRFTRIELT